ncbi:hypothetical protein ABGB07_09315 [Micromonosporaceae bacterium B7E4]
MPGGVARDLALHRTAAKPNDLVNRWSRRTAGVPKVPSDTVGTARSMRSRYDRRGEQRGEISVGKGTSQGVEMIALPDGTSAWLVTSYEHARQALSDQRLSKVLSAEKLGLAPELASACCSATRRTTHGYAG